MHKFLDVGASRGHETQKHVVLVQYFARCSMNDFRSGHECSTMQDANWCLLLNGEIVDAVQPLDNFISEFAFSPYDTATIASLDLQS